MIVQDLKRLVARRQTENSLRDVTIRVVAGLSSLSIATEPPDSNPTASMDYLLEERNAPRPARGARLKAVLTPPRRFARSLTPARLRVRYQRMIGLLRGQSDIADPQGAKQDLAAMKRCEFTLSPVPMPNLFIIGNSIAYEGMKRGGAGGFEVTHWETNPEELRHLRDQFDDFFKDSKRDIAHSRTPA
jgi:hypothetical protein